MRSENDSEHKADWLELEDALKLALSKTRPLNMSEDIPLGDALGRITAAAVYASLDNPPFDRSPLDGFVLNSADTVNASKEHPRVLRIAGQSRMGMAPDCRIEPGTAARILTGAGIPEGGDCVVPQEAVEVRGTDVLVFAPLRHHQNYVFRGEGVRKGELMISGGERLGSIHLGLLAGMGQEKVRVNKTPKVGILCTGDELAAPGHVLGPGKIYNSNGMMLRIRLRELGIDTLLLPDSADIPEEAAERIGSVIGDVDLFISSGGVCVGEKDIMHRTYELLGAERLYWRLAIKPGSAMLCGLLRDKLLLGLSGNPFACLCNFELIAKPVLAKIGSRPDLEPLGLRGILKTPWAGKPGGPRRFVRARLENGGVSLPQNHSSGQLLSLLNCNCLVDIPAGTGALPIGTEATLLLL
jgi:molybdopterin molybdotransferase